MKTLSMLIVGIVLILALAGCGGRNDKEINQDKDKPRAEEGANQAGLKKPKGALLQSESQETHPCAWVGPLPRAGISSASTL